MQPLTFLRGVMATSNLPQGRSWYKDAKLPFLPIMAFICMHGVAHNLVMQFFTLGKVCTTGLSRSPKQRI